MNESGIELIRKERREQSEKHGYNIMSDVLNNEDGQLAVSARLLMSDSPSVRIYPKGWSRAIWEKMINKPYRERLVIAGALIAAELDRLIYLEEQQLTKQQ